MSLVSKSEEKDLPNSLRWKITPSDSTICIGLPSDKSGYDAVRLSSDFISARRYNFFHKYAEALALAEVLPAFTRLSKDHGLHVVWNASLNDVAKAFAKSKMVILLTHCKDESALELQGKLVFFEETAAVIPEDWSGILAGTACKTGGAFHAAVRRIRGVRPRVISFNEELDLDAWLMFYAALFDALASATVSFGEFLHIFLEDLFGRLRAQGER